MLRLVRFLFTGDWHMHKWEQVETVNSFSSDNRTGRPRLIKYVCKCEICGKIKSFDIG